MVSLLSCYSTDSPAWSRLLDPLAELCRSIQGFFVKTNHIFDLNHSDIQVVTMILALQEQFPGNPKAS
ncbi:hypothetical protein A0H81_08987 [Grifola frondosa]|uniref:Uncharacterized protein n=1 Tax=Grifola frondosa TaxID=5627 RepID=A0A1C7M4N0_GRIFR|nr:hypothetical protein A0H81_08987 [Grifola frondosa]